MGKTCFVIMPYGGDDPALRKRFDGVYQSIIAPGASRAGYEVKRSDIAGAPGNIAHDIVRDLANADMVIADLTTGNANVFFELGIRHAFRKSGTIHIVDAAGELPFDVQQYRVIKYTRELDEVSAAVEAIAEAINKREKSTGRSDNPVHDAIPNLPLDIKSTGDEAIRQQLMTAERDLKDLRQRNETLTNRIGVLDPTAATASKAPALDIGGMLETADGLMKRSGPNAILRLRQALDAQGADAFARELKGVLESPYLDENDFAEINLLCKEAGLQAHRRVGLEVARVRYPYSREILILFLDALDDSPNPEDQVRGRLMLEERLGIEQGETGPRFGGKHPSLPLEKALLLLFSFYLRAGKFEWIIDLVDALPASLKNDVAMLCNKARSLALLGRPDEAEIVYRQALNVDPANDQTHLWYADLLDTQGKTSEAYEASERAILADPDDPNLWIHLAIQISNRGLYRTKAGRIEGPFPRKLRVAAMVPLGVKAVQLDSNAGNAEEVVRVLVRGGAIEAAQAVANDQLPQGNFDSSPLDYLLARISEKAGDVLSSDAA